MPNLAEDPSDIARFALHRLVATLLSLVQGPWERVALYEQVRRNPISSITTIRLTMNRRAASVN